MEGFDWLNLPPSTASPQASSPAPPTVSFGGLGHSESHIASPSSTAISENLLKPYAQSDPEISSDSSLPLSLTTQDLSPQESRTYIRWYSDILAKTNTRTILMDDVYKFLHNFRLSPELKDHLNRIFSRVLSLINIGEFFALLRIISHCLQGQSPSRALVKMPAPIPTPPSILRKKRQNHDSDAEEPSAEPEPAPAPGKPLDLDSFTQFMLTGERPDDRKPQRKKKLKSVKFSDQIVTDVHESLQRASLPITSPPNELDYSLPMDQLLSKMSSQSQKDEEQQVLQDMGSQLNHFQNLNSVDTASIDGVPASIHLQQPQQHQDTQLLRPNLTGPAQMSQYIQNHEEPLLKPNMTGPYDMMKMFSPTPQDSTPSITLQSFTNQMTGSTASNTAANIRISSTPSPIPNTNGYDRPLPPPPAPASRRARSLSSPTPTANKPMPPPPPPSRRRGGTLSPSPQPSNPPLPPKIPNSSVFYPSVDNVAGSGDANGMYENPSANSGSTADILDDLKELQAEVDRIRDMTGGF